MPVRSAECCKRLISLRITFSRWIVVLASWVCDRRSRPPFSTFRLAAGDRDATTESQEIQALTTKDARLSLHPEVGESPPLRPGGPRSTAAASAEDTAFEDLTAADRARARRPRGPEAAVLQLSSRCRQVPRSPRLAPGRRLQGIRKCPILGRPAASTDAAWIATPTPPPRRRRAHRGGRRCPPRSGGDLPHRPMRLVGSERCRPTRTRPVWQGCRTGRRGHRRGNVSCRWRPTTPRGHPTRSRRQRSRGSAARRSR